MSFFAPLSEGGPEPDSPRRRPAPWVVQGWNGPPDGVIGADVDCAHNLFHDDRLCLRLDRVRLYPTGLTLDLELWEATPPLVEGKELSLGFPWALVDADGPRERIPDKRPSHPDDYLRFGVLYDDGRRIATTGLDSEPHLGAKELALLPRDGSYRPGHKTVRLWLWPPPPPEPVTLYAEWPSLGIPEISYEISGAALRDAHPRIQELWPDG